MIDNRSTPILSVRNLSKSFTLHAIGRKVVSLRAVSLTVRAGEHLAMAGASGAGKSSLLRCIYRNYLPDEGTVLLHDEGRVTDLTALDDRAMARLRGRDFGYVSQFLSAPPRQGPLRLVTNAALRRGLSPIDAKQAAADSLHKLGIEEPLWATDCSVLSGGERQRVNLAAGTVSPPRLLLLDEPVSALDPANRDLALEVIENLRHQDVSVLAIYHDMGVIRRVANRVVVMESGRITADGAANDVLDAGHHALEEVYA
jgi:alpha-D-ribose 1-methylphosphonate 5-triphosphate synthase subunit PhnL